MTWSQSTDGFMGTFRDGVGWFCYPTERFKTITVHALWVRDLRPEDRALGALLPHVLKRGTRRLPSLLHIERELESLYGASFRADVGKLGDKQLLSFHINVVNGQFLPGQPDMVARSLAFLSEVMEDPNLGATSFPNDVVQQEKELVRRQISALINDKGQYAVTRLVEIMADGRPFGLRKWGSVEEVEAVSSDSLLHFYRQVKSESPFVVFVVGDVDPEKVAQGVEGLWPNRAKRLPIGAIEAYTPRHQNHEVIDRQDVQQGKLNLGYATGITARDDEYAALVMYAGVLGGFSHSKLFVNVREKASLAYYAYARVDAALALMLIGAGIEFKDYAAARQIIDQQLAAMRQGEISPEEMEFTKKAYENEIRSEEDNPDQLIGRKVEHLLVGGGLAGQALIDALAEVRIEDLKRVAEQVTLDTSYFLTSQDEGGSSDA